MTNLKPEAGDNVVMSIGRLECGIEEAGNENRLGGFWSARRSFLSFSFPSILFLPNRDRHLRQPTKIR